MLYERLELDKNFRKRVDRTLQEFKSGPSGKLEPRALEGARGMPWIFINHDARKKYCWFWNNVCTGIFNIIPSHCRFNCWKTVLKPSNVKECFECYEILKQLDLPSKIGMDRRDYSHTAWAGFIYGDTLEEGREYYKIVREAIPDEIDVYLKRGCTEMERLQPSHLWDEMAEKDQLVERKLHDMFSFQERHYHQAKWVIEEIKENWIKRAIEIGDPTAKETAEKYSGDPKIWDKLVVRSVTYHNEPEPEEKEEKEEK